MLVDCVINCFGKPYQTLATLKGLMKHNEQYIDKIYFIEEAKHPYGDQVKWILEHFDNIIHYVPTTHNPIPCAGRPEKLTDRIGVKYQYGIEKSDKKFLFITHNDVLYKTPIIKDMMEKIGDAVGIGKIGQCWNCPAHKVGLCGSDKWESYNPTYEEVLRDLPLPHVRTHEFHINKNKPMPLPECRMNEWSCLINREIVMKECFPNGSSPMFGQYEGIDVACGSFRSLVDKGYKFKHYNTDAVSAHGYWANDAGWFVENNVEKYWKAEEVAKQYLKENYEK
jgi:hypothetical protein